MSSSVAFFGATGGCTIQALIMALEDGITCRALVRTPEKLSKLLNDRGVNETAVKEHLTILKGNVKDLEDVKKTLLLPSGQIVNFILSGVGGSPNFKNPLRPTLDDPEICRSAAKTIVQAIDEIAPTKPPHVIAISTTGTSKNRDVPFVFLPLYHWALAVPHADKRIMEEILRQANDEGKIRYSIVRPSLLTDGARRGVDAVRFGTETKKESNPAIGYTISRGDTGGWIYEKIIEGGGEEFVGKDITVTY